MTDPTLRFSARVGDYQKHRPTYPPALIETLRTDCGLSSGSIVADIGSGTGILSRLFLDNGNKVYAVEPNAQMRAAAEKALGGRAGFNSVNGSAEATTLPGRSVDFVAAGQAFHWFDRARARREFGRILRPEGWIVIAWNDRDTGASPFMAALDGFIREHAIDLHLVDHTRVGDAELEKFFGAGRVRKQSMSHASEMDREGILGLLLSASYMPGRDHPGYQRMVSGLNALLNRFEERLRVAYTTRMYLGRLPPDS